MATLEIRDLHVTVETDAGAKEILRGVDLTVRSGRDPRDHGPQRLRQVHARLLDRRAPEVHGHLRHITLDGEDVLAMSVDERARAGLFLAMQYPVEVPGVSVSNFLRTAATAVAARRPSCARGSRR
jgi:Fe-S cluster assembly ATP-binding protein